MRVLQGCETLMEAALLCIRETGELQAVVRITGMKLPCPRQDVRTFGNACFFQLPTECI